MFGWRDITLIVDRSDVSARVLGESLDEGFQNGGIFPNIVTYYSDEKYDRATMLRDASSKSRGKIFTFSFAFLDHPDIGQILSQRCRSCSGAKYGCQLCSE